MRRAVLLRFALLALVAGTAQAQVVCPNPGAGATGVQSLRLMTYNAYMTVYPADNSSAYGISQAQRATLIAQRIIKDDPDIVALQEVDDDDAKQSFMAALALNGPYKHFIFKADRHNPLNDSGLMLFSKFPFGPLDHSLDGTSFASSEDWCGGESPVGTDFNGCNVKIYDTYESNGSDWWQNKGVVAVRALNTCNRNMPINLVFTHTQSKGDVNDSDCLFGQDVADLQEQLTTLRQVMEASFNAPSLLSQPTFLLGDINLDGNQVGANKATSKNKNVVITTQDPPSPGNPVPVLCSTITFAGENEWQMTFDSSDSNNGFFACRGNQPTTKACTYSGPAATGTYFVDSWAYNTSRDDPGQTQSGYTGGPLTFADANHGERDDYILHNIPKPPATGGPTAALCMQYIRRGFAHSADDLSDHLSVTADFNFPAPRCSVRPRKPGDSHLETGDDANPNGPEPVVFQPNPNLPPAKDVIFTPADGATGIANPGNMQWYVIDEPGAYEIITQGSVAYEVFQSANLSKRLSGASVECKPVDTRTQDCKFSLMKPPYYVRVFGATGGNPDTENRSFTGTYTIKFHRFDCSSLAEACLMEPGVEVTAKWPNTQLDPAHNSDTMYFYFFTEQAASGAFPEVSFLAAHQFNLQFDGNGNFIDPLTLTLVNKKESQVPCPGCTSPGGWQSQAPAPSPFASPTVTWANSLFLPNTWERLATALPSSLPGVVSWPEKYFVKVARDPAYINQASPQFITFTTSLTYFRPIELSAIEERTWIGYDDFKINWLIQEPSRPDFVVINQQIGDQNGDFETWDEGSKMAEAGSVNGERSPWPFTADTSWVGDGANGGQTLRPTLVEDVIDNDNYLMCEVDEGGTCWNVYSQGQNVQAKPKGEEDPGDPNEIATPWRWRDEISDSPYYNYVMAYKLRHQRMACRGTSGPSQSDCRGAGTACSASLPAFAFMNTSPRCVCTSNSGCPSGQTCNVVAGLCELP